MSSTAKKMRKARLRPLLAAGEDPAALLAMTLGELPPSRALDRLRARRAELGLPAGDDAAFLLVRDGREVLAVTDPHGTWLRWLS